MTEANKGAEKLMGCLLPPAALWKAFICWTLPLSFLHKQGLGQRASLHKEKCFPSIGIAATL